jgi:DNA-directed RNA polymerase subunit RPC12/RpoP
MPCYRCGRVQDDPPQGKPSRWGRGVVAGEQVLICPDCQRRHPDWTDDAAACPSCGYRKLSIKLGMFVCSKCGHAWEPVG